MIGWIIVIILVLIAFIWIGIYNSLIKLRNWIEEAWAQIDVQLKRRYDLIPNLVETVKEYMSYEQETLEKVIQARNQMGTTQSRHEQLEANDQLSGALRQLFALRESYPDLKASENFQRLQEELISTENKVAYARQLYNKTVLEYNNKIQTIPSNLIASMHHFKRETMLEATETERESVRVQF